MPFSLENLAKNWSIDFGILFKISIFKDSTASLIFEANSTRSTFPDPSLGNSLIPETIFSATILDLPKRNSSAFIMSSGELPAAKSVFVAFRASPLKASNKRETFSASVYFAVLEDDS